MQAFDDINKHANDLLENLNERGDGITIPGCDDVSNQVVSGTEFEGLMNRVFQ